jgi:hypothetical protein
MGAGYPIYPGAYARMIGCIPFTASAIYHQLTVVESGKLSAFDARGYCNFFIHGFAWNVIILEFCLAHLINNAFPDVQCPWTSSKKLSILVFIQLLSKFGSRGVVFTAISVYFHT